MFVQYLQVLLKNVNDFFTVLKQRIKTLNLFKKKIVNYLHCLQLDFLKIFCFFIFFCLLKL